LKLRITARRVSGTPVDLVMTTDATATVAHVVDALASSLVVESD